MRPFIGHCIAMKMTPSKVPFSEPAPVIAPRPASVLSPFGARLDEFYGLRDDSRADPEILEIMRRENQYFDQYLKPLGSLVQELVGEFKKRIAPNEHSVPLWDHGRWWQYRYAENLEYPQIFSGRSPSENDGELMFDPNEQRGDSDFYALGSLELSPDERVLAVIEDWTGRREYTLRFIERETGKISVDDIKGIEPEVVWINNEEVLYIRKDPVTLLGREVYRHRIGTSSSSDQKVYEEHDPEFTLSIQRSRSGHWVEIILHQTLTSEIHWARMDDPGLRFEVLLPRQYGIEYSAEDFNDEVIFQINENAPEFKLIRVAFNKRSDRSQWREILSSRSDVLIDDFLCFKDYFVVRERTKAQARLMRVDAKTHQCVMLSDVSGPAVIEFGANVDASLAVVRWSSSSLAQPKKIFDTALDTLAVSCRHQSEVPHCDLSQYTSERRWVSARDGQQVPVTLLMKATSSLTAQPCLLIGYGAYGISYDPNFRSPWLSLVDRGVVVAIAHIRGGQEMGRAWTEAGRRECKENTFNDFIDVAQAMATWPEIDGKRIAAMGGSAGGLLMGAVVNRAPECFRAIVAQVPFVDVLTTMLDESLPLTTNEYDEWGNPSASLEQYNRLLAYSPIDQTSHQNYPPMLLTTGLYDSQVQFWEPLKWLAQLRKLKTDSNPVFLRSDLAAGHGGKAGRFERLNEIAEEYCFVLNELGVG